MEKDWVGFSVVNNESETDKEYFNFPFFHSLFEIYNEHFTVLNILQDDMRTFPIMNSDSADIDWSSQGGKESQMPNEQHRS